MGGIHAWHNWAGREGMTMFDLAGLLVIVFYVVLLAWAMFGAYMALVCGILCGILAIRRSLRPFPKTADTEKE